MEIKGKIIKILDTQVVSDKFKKREFVLEHSDNPSYPQLNSFSLSQDKIDMIDGFNVGDYVKIEFNLRGKEWINAQGKAIYFSTLEVWKMETLQKEQDVQASQNTSSTPVDVSNGDDLPF